MSDSLVSYAENELKLAGLFDEDSDYKGELGKAVLDLVEKFSEQEHSGFSAGMCIQLFQRVSSFMPLSPLTGNDEEWNEVGNGIYQNKRCPSVFKDVLKNRTYNIDGKVFVEPNGAGYTSGDSFVDISFPYTVPSESERVLVDWDHNPISEEKWEELSRKGRPVNNR